MSLDFSPYQAVLLDLDGTVYHEDQPLPGAIELIKRLQSEQRPFACLSNSSASPLRIMARLEMMGVDIDPNNIYTAAAAACDYVVETFGIADGSPTTNALDSTTEIEPAPRRKPRAYNLATESVDEMLTGLVDWVNASGEPCDCVIVGPPDTVYTDAQRQRTALLLARQGAKLIGICADRLFPSPRGIEFGAGAHTWMLAYAAGVEPTFCGKPQNLFFHELCKRLNVDPAWCLLIGDNLESDVSGAKAVGMRTVLTLSGVCRKEDLASCPENLQPDLVVEDLRELV
ncbi:MAG: HAD hydrolase-like protein [Anaerolineae bacterium]|nr:HAD hydrolase-like protein [Phycisphaerae bacterium]